MKSPGAHTDRVASLGEMLLVVVVTLAVNVFGYLFFSR